MIDHEHEAPASAEARTVEDWRAAKATPNWLFAAAKVGKRWAIGQRITEADYDAAIARVRGLRSM